MSCKALFLIFHGFDNHNVGISKKIAAQVKALKQGGLDVGLCYFAIDRHGYHKRMIDEEVFENYGKGFFAKVRKRICYSKLTSYLLKQDIRFLYIRSFHNANPFLIRMLKKLKNNGIQSVLEIPTFPYDFEYKNVPLSDRPRIFLDRLLRKSLARYVYRIVTFSNDKLIFGTPTINLSNAIDFDQIRVKSAKPKSANDFRLIGVAEIHFWHGLDRVITGMADYYKKPRETKVFFDIVGEGVPEEINRLKTLVTENMLNEYVAFHGTRTGDELDLLFEKADMGVASLGRHRSNITSMKSLKNREYAARGIPFVYSETDDDFEKMPYILKAPADDSPLDIGEVVAFYYSQNLEPVKIRNTIIDTLSWNVQMRKVIDNCNVTTDE